MKTTKPATTPANSKTRIRLSKKEMEEIDSTEWQDGEDYFDYIARKYNTERKQQYLRQ